MSIKKMFLELCQLHFNQKNFYETSGNNFNKDCNSFLLGIVMLNQTSEEFNIVD